MSINANDIIKDVSSTVVTWKDYVDGLGLLAHYDPSDLAIIIDYIKVPANLRRQGIASQIIEEFKDVATLYGIPILIQPDDAFGTPQPVLMNLYAQNGFGRTQTAYMRWEA